MTRVVSAATPYISKATQRHLRTTDPVMIGKAKSLFIRSLPRFDPSKASLPTYIDRQLQPLIRWQAERTGAVNLPDRMRTDLAQLARMEKEYLDEYGRQPSTRQLAELSGISTGRIAKIRQAQHPVFASSTPMGDGNGEMTDEFGDMGVYNDAAASQAWLRIVRSDLSDIDQTILEHTLGLDGAEVLSNKNLAERLNLSPGAISQRKARIQSILDRESELNPFK
jgi:RNA polymerase primary sigma factor